MVRILRKSGRSAFKSILYFFMNPLSGVQPFFTVTVIFFEYIFWYIFPFDLLDSCCIPRSIAVHALAAEG